MKQRRNVRRPSKWKWAALAFLVAVAAGGALYSMNVRTASTSTGAALSPAAAGVAVKTPVASKQPGATQAGATATATATLPGGSMSFIDPVTLQPREPSPEEIAALIAAGPATIAAEPEPIVGADGSPGLRLTDEHMTFMVATRNADGKVSVGEAAGKTEALQKVRAASAGGIKAGKERNDVQ